jgi:hypothetical protein
VSYTLQFHEDEQTPAQRWNAGRGAIGASARLLEVQFFHDKERKVKDLKQAVKATLSNLNRIAARLDKCEIECA